MSENIYMTTDEYRELKNIRPAVLKFALLMEQKLKENDHKGGWVKCTNEYLFGRLEEETAELQNLFLLDNEKKDYRAIDKNLAKLEAADVANFAMMIADNLNL